MADSRPHYNDFEEMHAQPGGAYAEACRQLQQREIEVATLRELLIEALGWIEPSLGGLTASTRIRKQLKELNNG